MPGRPGERRPRLSQGLAPHLLERAEADHHDGDVVVALEGEGFTCLGLEAALLAEPPVDLDRHSRQRLQPGEDGNAEGIQVMRELAGGGEGDGHQGSSCRGCRLPPGRLGRCSSSCHRAIVQHRSDKRLR